MTAPKKKIDRSERRLLRLYFLLPMLGAISALVAVFFTPSEGSSVWLLGLSTTRWLLVAALLGFGLIFGSAFLASTRKTNLWANIEKQALGIARSKYGYFALITLSLIGISLFFYLSLLTFKFTDALVQTRLLRLLPLFLWALVLAAETVIIFPVLRFGSTRRLSFREAIFPAILALTILAIVLILISASGLGLEPDRAGWGVPGVPLLATQVALAWLVSLVVCGIFRIVEIKTGWKMERIDLLACLVIWIAAFWLWQLQVSGPTFFSPSPRAPNFESYPYSDAASHDLVAQNLLVGEGFSPVAEKPLYSFFLAILHLFAGQNYTNMLTLQVLVLSFFPAVLYLLASFSQNRFSGILLALITIWRESNSMALSGQIDVSHAKMLMTDLPTAFALALFTLLTIRWLRANERAWRWPIFIGAALGMLVLLRSQILVFLPVFLFIALSVGGLALRNRVRYAGLFLLGFGLVALPWIISNGVRTGQFGYSQPLQALYLAKQYSLTPEANDPGFPANTPVSQYVRLGFAQVFDFATSYPVETVRFIASHFFHNEVSSFLTLPIRFDLADKIVTFYNLRPYWIGAEDRLWANCCSLSAHIANNPYWTDWNGNFPPESALPIVFNLALVSIGVGVAWKHVGWAGLVPAGLHVAYNFSTAVARVSGWRLNLPVDWVLLLYYCLGIGQLTFWVWAYISSTGKSYVEKVKRKPQRSIGWKQENLTRISGLILLAGLVLPLSEAFIPAEYQEITDSGAIEIWHESSVPLSSFDAESFLEQPAADVFIGKALWPRFYPSNAGEPAGAWPAFNPLPFPRLGFVLIGPQGTQVVFPLDASPKYFPHAAEVIVFGCEETNYFRAVAVVIRGQSIGLVTDRPNFLCNS